MLTAGVGVVKVADQEEFCAREALRDVVLPLLAELFTPAATGLRLEKVNLDVLTPAPSVEKILKFSQLSSTEPSLARGVRVGGDEELSWSASFESLPVNGSRFEGEFVVQATMAGLLVAVVVMFT